jgi:hypothetical protein
MHRDDAEGIPLTEIQRAELCLAEPHGIRQHGFKHEVT